MSAPKKGSRRRHARGFPNAPPGGHDGRHAQTRTWTQPCACGGLAVLAQGRCGHAPPRWLVGRPANHPLALTPAAHRKTPRPAVLGHGGHPAQDRAVVQGCAHHPPRACVCTGHGVRRLGLPAPHPKAPEGGHSWDHQPAPTPTTAQGRP